MTGTAGDLYVPLRALHGALAHWDGRVTAASTAEERRAASRAVAQIDAMLLALHDMRARLIGEIRQADDAAAARADALLQRAREAREADSAGRNDTHTTRDNPRAAGAASDRGAQPSGQRAITICQLCRKRVYQVRNGEWYHDRNSSAFCDHTDGTHRKAARQAREGAPNGPGTPTTIGGEP